MTAKSNNKRADVRAVDSVIGNGDLNIIQGKRERGNKSEF
jgi:hypothetical protein